jgi:hypothetical protein
MVEIRRIDGFPHSTASPKRSALYARPDSGDDADMSSWERNVRDLKQIQEEQIQDQLMNTLFLSEGSGSMMPISLVGQARIRLETNQTALFPSSTTTSLLVLAAGQEKDQANRSPSQNAILVPLTVPGPQLRLLSFAYAKNPLPSLTLLLSLNSLLVNRDNALFDNLPWATWSRDPQMRNRDAAGNDIDPKFHLGKRDAYNRFMGKDWPGRSLALGNMALRLKYMTAKKKTTPQNEAGTSSYETGEMENQTSLVRKILEIRVRELQMELAELDSKLSIVQNNPEEYTMQDLNAVETQRFDMEQDLKGAKADLKLLSRTAKDAQLSPSDEEEMAAEASTASIMDRIANWSTKSIVDKTNNEAPYRGAMGYAPMLDSQQSVEQTFLESSYRSPYDLLKEILSDQLNAKVIGCALENTSLLKGNLVLGGAIVIQRETPTKTIKLAGEEVKYEDYDEDYGNQGINGGKPLVVECDVDEAVGVALACEVPLSIERSIFEQAAVVVDGSDNTRTNLTNIKDILPMWKIRDSAMSIQVEGDVDRAERASPISIPRTSASLFDNFYSSSEPSSLSMFPTDNPIKSLQQLDELDNSQKAKTLLEMSNFNDRLPRPRAVKSSPPNDNPLDKLLLPLIDESVRREYQIRQAEQQGDTALAEQLRNSKSKLQEAREKANAAREQGNEDLAEQWETEAKFLETLRADVTQDEGAYSRFLDRDDWYERDRQRTAKRTKKSSFGNLLDGIE